MSRVSFPVLIFALVSLLIVLSGFLFLSYERKSVEPSIIKAPTAQATLTWRKMYKSGYGSYLIVSHQNIGTYEVYCYRELCGNYPEHSEMSFEIKNLGLVSWDYPDKAYHFLTHAELYAENRLIASYQMKDEEISKRINQIKEEHQKQYSSSLRTILIGLFVLIVFLWEKFFADR